MRISVAKALVFGLVSGVCLDGGSSQAQARVEPVDAVNLLIGTGGEGQTFPGAGVPFGMTQWTPQTRATEAKCISPYYVADTRIQGFRGSHFMSGSCTQDYGSVTLMPLSGELKLRAEERASAFDRSSEVLHPYKNSVDLKDYGIHAEITGANRSGMLRFRFGRGGRSWMLVQNNARKGDGYVEIDAAHQEITGRNAVRRLYAGQGKLAGFSGYFVVQFDRPFAVGGTWSGAAKNEGRLHQDSEQGEPGAYLSFDLKAGDVVQARVGTSFTSVDEATKNLKAEIPSWNFDTVASRSRTQWAEALGRIQIPAESPERRIFYTAMYHAMQLPRTFSDVSGSYPRFATADKTEQANGFVYYDDFSVWDTFRSLHPLLTILDPARERDMVQSLLVKGQQGGFLPIFPAWNSYTSEMVGDHADSIIADAYFKGIRGFDVQEAYRLMRKNALEAPGTLELYRDGRGRRALESYMKYGYIPLEDKVSDAFHKEEQVSRTLEYAYDDAVVGDMAAALGKTEDAALFHQRAQNYRNVIDPETGFARGRHADGSWDSPFDPAGMYKYITEGLPYQYTFFVPQDVPGLMEAVHGRDAFVKKLDGLFAGKYYNHGNEPSHHIAYLYDYAGQAYKTQEHVHTIMGSEYHDLPDGLAGNDDAGQISAWYIFSALGFYPVSPGTPKYQIGTSRFDDASILLPSGKRFRVRAEGASKGRFYIKSASLNGKPLERPWISHAEIVAGRDLVFEMSAQPNPAWPKNTE